MGDEVCVNAEPAVAALLGVKLDANDLTRGYDGAHVHTVVRRWPATTLGSLGSQWYECTK